MVKSIINVRRSSISLAWSEGTDNGRQKTRNHGYDISCGEAVAITQSPSQTCHAKPKTQINRRRTLQLLSRWWKIYRKQLGLKDFSPKSQDAVACSRLRAWRFTYDRGDIPSGRRPLRIWASLPGAGAGQFEHKADSLIAKFKEAGGTVREIDV